MEKYTLPEMPYAYDALEPHIDARTMEIHHTKHHQKYTDGMNGALEKLSPELQSKDIVDILSSINDVPDDVRGAIKHFDEFIVIDDSKVHWKGKRTKLLNNPSKLIKNLLY